MSVIAKFEGVRIPKIAGRGAAWAPHARRRRLPGGTASGCFLKREVVVSAGAGHEAGLVGKEGAVGVEGVVDLADGEEDVACGAEGGGGVARVVVVLERREQIGVLGDEDLDEEEQGRIEEAETMIGNRLPVINATAMLECVRSSISNAVVTKTP